MVETLTNIKNGKNKAGSANDPSNEAASRMKKFLSGLGRKRRRKSCHPTQWRSLTLVLASEPLRVSLDDLLSADKKGKWWLVGAGWSGNPLVDRQQAQGAITVCNASKTDPVAGETDEEKLLDLARKQGMNTDVRRSVFVVLMTSEVGLPPPL